jgi:hypothetical protein
MSKQASSSLAIIKISSRFTALLAVWGLAALFAGCGVGDQLCPTWTNPNDKDDDCPYGPPSGGAQTPPAACPEVTQKNAADCEAAPTWTADIFPIFDSDAGAKCTSSNCHGSPTPPKIALPAGDAASSYTALTGYTNPAAGNYVDRNNPEKSWLLCNIGGAQPSVGSTMPIGGGTFAPGDLQKIQDWLACGASDQ